MKHLRRQNLILVLVILGLVTSGISPACKFISGQSDLIEICTSFGIEKIPAPPNDTTPQDSEHKLAAQCAFCLSAQLHKTIIADTGASDFAETPHNRISPNVKTIQAGLEAGFYEATGPPAFS